MRKVRGIIALAVAIIFGLIAVKAVSHYLKKPAVKKQVQNVSKPKLQEKPFAAIPEGMRIMTIEVNNVSGVSRKLQKGDVVDIVATSPLPETDGGRVSRIVLQQVQVHSVSAEDVNISKKLAGRGKKWTVSLLLNQSDAALLAAAAKGADITLIAGGSQTGKNMATNKAEQAGYLFTRDQGPRQVPIPEKDFSMQIPIGMRAVTVPVKETDGICGLLKPGDHVDVILTCAVSKVAGGSDITAGQKGTYTEYRMHSRMLCQNVKVLTTETSIKTGGLINQQVKYATLLVSPQDAVTLSSALDASKKAFVKLIHRTTSDSENPKTKTVYLDEILTQKKSYRDKVHVLRGVKTEVYSF